MPTLPNNPFQVTPRPLFPKTNIVIIYNSDPALGSGTANWSYQVAQWYCLSRGLQKNLYAIDFSKIWDGSASGYNPTTALAWNGGGLTAGTTFTNLWATYGTPLANYLKSVKAQAILCSAGTPTIIYLPSGAFGEAYISVQALFGMWLTWDHINTLTGTVKNPCLRQNVNPQVATGGIIDGQSVASEFPRTIAPVSYDYRPNIQAPDQGGFQNPGLTNYNNFASYDLANTVTSYTEGAGPPNLYSPIGWGSRPHGRIGRPRFGFEEAANGGTGLPGETAQLAYTLVTQALKNQFPLETARTLGTHIGVSTYAPGAITNYEGATLVGLMRSSGFTRLYYYTLGALDALATAITPASSETYSYANLVGAGVGPYPAWLMLGSAIRNTVYSNPGILASWNMHPGAWGFEETSYSWEHVARIQLGGGIGGMGSVFEPSANNAGGVVDYAIKVLQGMSLMEAAFYSSTLYWQLTTTTFGDPLYTPVVNLPPFASAPGPRERAKKEKKGPLYLAR